MSFLKIDSDPEFELPNKKNIISSENVATLLNRLLRKLTNRNYFVNDHSNLILSLELEELDELFFILSNGYEGVISKDFDRICKETTFHDTEINIGNSMMKFNLLFENNNTKNIQTPIENSLKFCYLNVFNKYKNKC